MTYRDDKNRVSLVPAVNSLGVDFEMSCLTRQITVRYRLILAPASSGPIVYAWERANGREKLRFGRCYRVLVCESKRTPAPANATGRAEPLNY